MKETLIVVALSAVLFVFFGNAVYTSIMLPDVHFDYKTKDCVRVNNYSPDDNYSCELLPQRYRFVWVVSE